MIWLIIITFNLGGQMYQTTGPLDREICLGAVAEARAGRPPIISDAGGEYEIVSVSCRGPDGTESTAMVMEVRS